MTYGISTGNVSELFESPFLPAKTEINVRESCSTVGEECLSRYFEVNLSQLFSGTVAIGQFLEAATSPWVEYVSALSYTLTW